MIKEKSLKKDYIETEGEVKVALPNATFVVKIASGAEIICYISGKIRKNSINILPGDMVNIEVSVYDPSKGRIVYRKKGGGK